MHGMNDTKSHGPDNFSCFLIKKVLLYKHYLYLCYFSVRYIREGKLSDIWKTTCSL